MLFALKSSKYIIKHAIGALVAPENTPTSPKAAQNANNIVFAMLVCIISFFISGHKGIYKAQLWNE